VPQRPEPAQPHKPAQPLEPAQPLDARLAGWNERLARRTTEAVAALTAVPGVTGLVLGGSVGRGQHWPMSDVDLMALCSGRDVQEVAADVDLAAYQLSALWGSSGIYTAVDAGRLTFDETDVRQTASGGLPATLDRMADPRWLHGIDKIYGGIAIYDPHGAAAAFLDWSSRHRFATDVVARRRASWCDQAEHLLRDSERLERSGDATGAWIGVRRAGAALAEAATECWGQRAGSLGRYWTLFEARARRHGDPELADRVMTAAHAHPRCVSAHLDAIPEWLQDRIALSYAARRLVAEEVTPEQNARDNVLAFAQLYRSRFPSAQEVWMRAEEGAALEASIAALAELLAHLRR
jgi:predicted nucleotidyltransferase